MTRDKALSEFLGTLTDVLDDALPSTGALAPARPGAIGALQTLKTPGDAEGAAAQTLPVVENLDTALANAHAVGGDAARIAAAFAPLADRIPWRRRPGSETGPADFAAGHASAHIFGPEGIERRGDVTIGASLLAPNVVYPDHRHPPEEIYVVLSEGDWRREGEDWRRPGPGGLVHHTPNIVHAMRSGAAPLFAIWMLWTA